MPRTLAALASVLLLLVGVAPIAQAQTELGFFITSIGPGDGANLGGLAGADAHCQSLAEAAGSSGRTWRAYLSTQDPVVNARDRIGSGPWFNANGVLVAANVEQLLSDAAALNKGISVTESKGVVNGRGDRPNMHDILTGSLLDGMAPPAGEDATCSNWTSNSEGAAWVGHHDRTGGGANPTSWSTAHPSRGCSQANLQRTGGNGLFYCFAAN